MNETSFLRIPLYNLHKIKNISTYKGLTTAEIEHYSMDYDKEELDAIVSAVKWGVKNPSFDFKSLLPDLSHSNADIYKYLTLIEPSLGNLK